jgi:Flp pilus assembly protein TadD
LGGQHTFFAAPAQGQRARGLAPKEVVLICALADLYSKEGKFPQAIALLRQARELEPVRVEGANNLSTALLIDGRSEWRRGSPA